MQWGAKSNSQVSHLCIIWASSLPTAKASISTRGSWGSYLKFVRKTILGHKHLVAIQFSCSVVSDSLWHHGLQHPRLPCPSPTPRAYSNSRPSHQWCHPAISSSVDPFSSCLQSFPAPGFFPISQFFTSGGRNIGVSASASVLPILVAVHSLKLWLPQGLWERSHGNVCSAASVGIDSLWPYGLEPIRILCPWDSPGENTGVMPSSRDPPNVRHQTCISRTAAGFFTAEPPGKPYVGTGIGFIF